MAQRRVGSRAASLSGLATQVFGRLPILKALGGVPAWRGFFRSPCLLTMRDRSAN